MSQKKIKQEKRELKNMQQERGAFGKWLAALIGIAVVGGGIYAMTRNNSSVPSVNKNNDTKMEDTQADKKPESSTTKQAVKPETKTYVTAVIETVKGTIKVKLYPGDAPKTVANFISLVGKKFYDGLTFHRVEPGFVIQGGDPKGNGMGGSGSNIPLEIKCQDGTMTEGKIATCEPLLKHLDGALAMARSADPNSASSQFYITMGPQSFLDKNYAVFGYVTEGLDVVSKIAKGDVMKRVYLEK